MGQVANWCYFIGILLTAYISIKVYKIFAPPGPPVLENTWWGYGNPENEDKSIYPFQINVSDEILDDLQYRLEHARNFALPLEGVQQQYGINSELVKDILKYWTTEYKWREREKFLNKFPQFTTSVQGLKIHYIHVKPQNVPETINVLPLLLLHGWPGSLREFYDIIPILTTPRTDADIVFEVIAPHLPGYGFSEAAIKSGLGAAQTAVLFKNFMYRLGFEKFYGQGGDFGSIILQHMSVLFPESVQGFHSNMCIVSTPWSYVKLIFGSFFPSKIIKEGHEDRVYPLSKYFQKLLRETGYLHLQATKPDTLGIAMSDSPVGLAAYLLEKFIIGTNENWLYLRDGGLKLKYSYSTLIDNVMFYWVPNSITSAFRLYAETFNPSHMKLGITRIPIKIPTACARFRYDFYSPDANLREIYSNLVHLADYEGGHFAALENPKTLADDIFEGIQKMRREENIPYEPNK